MKDKRRSVNTRFWDDPFVEDLNPNEKLLFLYLLTNPLTNLLGIYEITVKRIAYDTGLKTDTIRNGLEGFEKVKKAFFVDNYIVLPNWLKNQQLNTNMKVAVVKEFNDLPNHIKDSILGNGSKGLGNDTKGFRMIMERLDKYEREIEEENESKEEDKKNNKKDKDPISFYANEILRNRGKKYFTLYLKFVKTILGRREGFEPLTNVLQLEQQVTYNSFVNLMGRAQSQKKSVYDVLVAMDNMKGLTKKYISVSKTAQNWLNRQQ